MGTAIVIGEILIVLILAYFVWQLWDGKTKGDAKKQTSGGVKKSTTKKR